MARMDPSLIGVNTPSIGNAFAMGQRAGQAARESQGRNALNAFLQEKGGDVMAGQPEALNALATMGADGFGMAQDVQARNEQREQARERLGMIRAEAARNAEAHAAKMTAAQRQADIQKIETGLLDALKYFERNDEAGFRESLIRSGVEPFPMEDFIYQASAYEGFAEGLKRYQEVTQGGPASDSAAEQEISRLMETGLDRTTAINIADGVWVTSQNPQTGEVQVIDKATGRPVSQQSQHAAQPAPTPELSFGDRYTASPKAFGLGGTIRGAANAVGDTLGAGQPFPDVADTQSDFGVLRETLVNDLASGYQRQPPSWLLQQIQDLTPRAGSPLQGPDGAQDKLAALGRSVMQELESLQGQLRNRRMRPTLRQELEGQAASLQKVLDRVAEAHGSFQPQGLAISPDVQERMRAYE